MIFIYRLTMSLIEAPQITINTPFTIDESILTGFDYTITPIEYLRYGVGKAIYPDDYERGAHFERYTETLKEVAEGLNIKVLSLNEITIGEETFEFFTFLITINRYTITPKETLTAEQEWRFANKTCSLLESIKKHPLNAFFTCENMKSHSSGKRYIVINQTSINLPDVFIWVDEYITDEDELKIIKYIDQHSAYYRNQYMAIPKWKPFENSWSTSNVGWGPKTNP